ncbi:MAG: hypothetical protein IMY86_07460 [Chloroflexi bacterium]|nr:hypothetical protein [Chloroflexota bacterium]
MARGTMTTILAVLLATGFAAQAREADPALDPALARLDSLTVLDHSVVRELVNLGPSTLPDVFRRLHSGNRHTAFAAGLVIGELGDQTTVSQLLEEWAAATSAEQYSGAATALMNIVVRDAVPHDGAGAESADPVDDALLERVFCAGPWAKRLQSGEEAPLLRVSVRFPFSREARYLVCGAGGPGSEAPSLIAAPEDSSRAERVVFRSRVMLLKAAHKEMPAWAEVMGQPPSALAWVTVTHALDSEYPGDSALWARCSGQWRFVQVVELMAIAG